MREMKFFILILTHIFRDMTFDSPEEMADAMVKKAMSTRPDCNAEEITFVVNASCTELRGTEDAALYACITDAVEKRFAERDDA